MNITMSERFELNAAIERLVGDDPSFSTADAALVIAKVPLIEKASPLMLAIESTGNRGSAEGYSPGVGNVRLDDEKDLKATLGVPQPARVGGYKLYHRPGRIVIGLMGSQIGVMPKDNDHVQLRYGRVTKVPTALRIIRYRTVNIPVWPGSEFSFCLARWDHWKRPA